MNDKKKPEPPLVDDRHDRLIEPLGDKETPIEDDVEQADDDLKQNKDDGKTRPSKP
ncbi:MAG: hypothetical protein Q7T86_02245 [Hyphomicrobiaceae bacterium]|nr:hypothetical protein [Hyphomicrobiaceae bacterium]